MGSRSTINLNLDALTTPQIREKIHLTVVPHLTTQDEERKTHEKGLSNTQNIYIHKLATVSSRAFYDNHEYGK
ncbi:MAG TPA: hypothetical protein VH878_09150 [Thermodesulfobacteriota bacterium]